MLYEGFWKSANQKFLALPVENDKPWKGKKVFLEALRKKQTKARRTLYRGWSTCRCCGASNGSAEFSTAEWTWPEGYAHYIEEHNVQPSLAFLMYVMGAKDIRTLGEML